MDPVGIGIAAAAGIVGGPLFARLAVTAGAPHAPAVADQAGPGRTSGSAGLRVSRMAVLAIVAAAVVLGWILLRGGQPMSSAAAATHTAFAGLGAVLAVTDLRWRRLPNVLVGAGALLLLAGFGVAALTGDPLARLRDAAAAGAGVLVIGVVGYILLRGGIGGGDVKLAAVLGVFLGWHGLETTLIGFLLAFVLGGLVALVAMLRHGVGAHVPFGPVLLVGAWTAVILRG